jgi:cytochrome c biogenesis protein CcmG/thiol:disulfide interchange protein DsbE
MFRNRRSLALITLAVALILSMIAVPSSPARAQKDVAMRIYNLARELHDYNVEFGTFTTWVNGDLGEDPAASPGKLDAGQTIPDFKFKNFDKAGEVKRADLAGKAYFLNFWASWCPPCREEFPLIGEAIDDGSLSLPIYFVNVLDTKVEAQRFLWTMSPELSIVSDDAKSTYARRYRINSIPQTILVDANGKIQAIHSGGLSELPLKFLLEIAAHPGVGAFDANNPDEPPPDMPIEGPKPVAATPAATKAK